MSTLPQSCDHKQLASIPFKSSAHGDWFVTESTDCGGLIQTSISGVGNATHLGLIDVIGIACLLPPIEYYFDVTYVAANGDSLFWESTEVFLSEEGLFEGGMFSCTGGSERFINAEGTITVDEILTVTVIDQTTGLPLAGTFENTALGTLTN